MSRERASADLAIASERAAIFQERRDVSAAAAVRADAAAVVEDVVPGRDVDEADRAEPELGRQRAGDEGDSADQIGFQNTPKAGDAVGQHDAVDPELHIGVIVADMEQAARRGILRDPGRLQQHFLDRLVDALGQRLDVVMADLVGSGADGGEQTAAQGIECLGFFRELTSRGGFGSSLAGWTGAGAGRVTATLFLAGFFLVATTSTVGKVTEVCAKPIPPRQ